MKLNEILVTLLSGDISCINMKNIIMMNVYASQLYNKPFLTDNELDDLLIILKISNILYNNTDKDILVLDDGVYDLELELYKKYRDDKELVGAIPVHFTNLNESFDDIKNTKEIGIEFPNNNDMMFADDIGRTLIPILNEVAYKGIEFPDPSNEMDNLRIVGTAHNYPNLVGTLTKNKFVLNKQAKDAGAFNDKNVKIFERDFIGNHILSGIYNQNRWLKIILELKYDGVSVEADIVGDHIEHARSRGDANADLGADLTPILKGYQFKRATDRIDPTYSFGMQFEAIITFENLKIFNEITGQNYKNCRTAISGLFGRKDAWKYKDLITLVPIRTSLEDIDRITEIEFMNEYYSSGVCMKYSVIEGNYIDILFKTKVFVDEAEFMRHYMNFMYDGVVMEYLDKDIIEILGRKNSINQFSTAIKFNPLSKNAYITGLTGTVGKDGKITPMIHYTAVEFLGTIHTKSSLHSYDRYLTERPAIGKIAKVVHVNDVMPYVTIPNNSYNESIEELIPYPTVCPCCGTPLVLGDSGKNWYCPNMNCEERNIRRIVGLLDILNIKGFAESTMLKLKVTTLRKLLSLTFDDVSFLGNKNGMKLIDRINQIKNTRYPESKVIGGLGFTNISEATWELILTRYTLFEIYQMYMTDKVNLKEILISIGGIGPVTACTIINEFEFFRKDIDLILSMNNIYEIKGAKEKIKVRFTNCRDDELMEKLNESGYYDANDKKGVTKTTNILLIPNAGFTGPSGKYSNAISNGFTKIIPISEFRERFYNGEIID